MASDDGSESGTPGDTREQGIEFGQLKEKLDSHDYPATNDELVEAYGDYELELPGGSQTLEEILGKRRSESGEGEEIRYQSAEDVHQSIHNMVGSDAVGREGYSDRGGSITDQIDEQDDQEQDSV